MNIVNDNPMRSERMMDRKKKSVLPFVFIIVFLVLVAYITSHRRRVLVVLSYHPEFSWEKEIADEIEKELSSSTVDVRLHYMDTKRHPDPEFKAAAGEETRKIIDSWDPAVIITVDDNAQEYVGRYYAGRKTPYIVFCGVNAKPEQYGYTGCGNATGILERVSATILVDVIQYSFPQVKRFIHISDDSFTSHFIRDEFKEKDWSPLTCVGNVLVDTFDDWKNAVLNAGNEADLIVYTHYHAIRRRPGSTEIVPSREVMKWTIAHSPLPEIGTFGFMSRDGGMMAVAVSSREQADVASDYAKKLLNGADIATLPVVSTSVYSFYINKSRLKQAGVHLHHIYTLLAETAGNVVE